MSNKLKELRENRKISTRELGTYTNINYGTLSRIENGLQQMPEPYAIILADYFNVSIDYLLGREWHDPETVVYKEKPITYDVVLSKLHTFTNQELVRIIGAAEGTLNAREGSATNGQYSVANKATSEPFAKKTQS